MFSRSYLRYFLSSSSLLIFLSHIHTQGVSLQAEDLKKIALDVASALKYLHSLPDPVVHFDIKSANVLLDRTGSCKLADFGYPSTSPFSPFLSPSYPYPYSNVSFQVGPV